MQPFILEHFESDSQAFSASKQVMYLFIFPRGNWKLYEIEVVFLRDISSFSERTHKKNISQWRNDAWCQKSSS